ncbi:Spo0E family sporulation regulatory protein-aspartic acid phosphatase [Jeotgalibacillus marinus]|uniref:Aspartyl-phosphate phosphatase Spo0E family protein n=1 Tax=Jeotgalibacillus marinus TaxID=86667 RepID=A0ABV3Q0B9_9BACL
MNRVSIEQLLLKKINRIRKEMINTAFETGINSTETLHCSEKLDKLINLHVKYFSNKAHTEHIIAS